MPFAQKMLIAAAFGIGIVVLGSLIMRPHDCVPVSIGTVMKLGGC